MKVTFIIFTTLFAIGAFYGCDNNNSVLDENSTVQVTTLTRVNTDEPDVSTIDDSGGGSEGNNSTEHYFFSGDNFSYKKQEGSAVFILSFDKTRNIYPLTSFMKFIGHYNTKYELLKCSATNVQYDNNNNLQYFEVIVQYNVYKNQQKPGKPTEYVYNYYETKSFLLKYTRQ